MPPFRNLHWAGLGLVSLLAIVLAVLWLARPKAPAKAPEAPRKETRHVTDTTIRIVGEPQRLALGQPIERELKGGEGHAYELELRAAEYAYVVVEQKGADVAVRLIGPDGRDRIRVDSPNGNQGPEPVHEVADAPGIHLLEVVCEDFEAAAGHYEIRLAALRPSTEADRKRVLAERQFAEAEELRRAGKMESYHRARDLYRETLATWQEQGLADREADAWFGLGGTLRALSDFEESIAAYRQALPLYRKVGRRDQESVVLDRIGVLHYRRSEFPQALEHHIEALKIARELGDRELELSALHNTANVYVTTGEAPKALESYRLELSTAQETGDRKTQGYALYGIGDALTSLGKWEQALDALQQALELHRKYSSVRDQANTLGRIANVYQRLGRLADSRAYLEQALAMHSSSGDRDGESYILNDLGTVYLHLGEIDKAGGAYRRALALSRETGSRHSEAFALLNLGRSFYEAKAYQNAWEHHDRSAEIFREIGYRPGEVSTLFGSARALHRTGNHIAAHERLERVLAGVEVLRDESDSVDLRTSYFARKQHYYDLHLDVMMQLHVQQPHAGWDAAALQLHERRRARGMLDLLNESGAEIRRGIDPSLRSREQNVEQELATVDRSLQALWERQSSAKQVEALEKRQRELLLELDAIRTEIRTRSPRYASLVRPEPLSLPDIQSQVVGEKSLLLIYSLGEERSFLWCIPRHGPMTSHVLPPRSWIEDAARQAHHSLKDRGQRQARSRWLKELSEVLLQPVKDSLGDRILVVVADGALEALPFSVLPDPREEGPNPSPLVVKNEVVSLPSVTALATLRRELDDRLQSLRDIAVLADPVFSREDERLAGRAETTGKRQVRASGSELERSARDFGLGSFERLPYTGEEAAIIRELVPEDQRFEATGFEASKAAVVNGELQGYRVLHFATHGLLNAKHPELSGLVFSLVDEQGKPQDGFLRGYEICNLDLPAELAVLSACQTGLGSEVRGEGLVGLTRSFMYAGVPRIVVSLWNVSDRGTAELMKRFYRGLFQYDLRPAKALRCAQLAMLDEKSWQDPYYWGAFVFQGEWRQESGSPDDDIEARATGIETAGRPDDDLPPPGILRTAGCPKLD